jgi:hypothetical protein
MPKYKIALTRDTTETAFVTVEAENSGNAMYSALDLLDSDPQIEFKIDDTTPKDCYVSDCEEL